MSTISNFMLANLAERLTPLLQTPVEDIVYEILDRKGLPTRSEIRDLKNRLERIDEEVKKLNEELARYREMEPAPEAAPAEAVVVEEPAEQPAPADEPAPVEPPKKRRGRPPRQGPPPICHVDGCDLPVRSKGFCAKHYQAWRRGRLSGFIDPEGMLLLDDKGLKVKVDKRYGAEAATFTLADDKVLVQVKGKEIKRKKPAPPKGKGKGKGNKTKRSRKTKASEKK